MLNYAYVNGRILPSHRATVSIFDRGLVLGDGLFETLRAIGGVPEFYLRHDSRIRESARKLRIRMPLKPPELARVIHRVTRKSRIDDAWVRIILTRGPYGGSLSIASRAQPTLIVSARKVEGLSRTIYRRGVRVAVSSVSVEAARGVDPGMKTINYLANIFAKAQADKKGCYEAILTGKRGEIAELTTSSFFGVIEGRVCTPPLGTGILPGITRQVTLELLAERKAPCAERRMYLSDVPKMEEAFLTSSVRGIVPIVEIAGMKIPGPGKATAALRKWYALACQKDREKLQNRLELPSAAFRGGDK